jgi:hypothetical protein
MRKLIFTLFMFSCLASSAQEETDSMASVDSLPANSVTVDTAFSFTREEVGEAVFSPCQSINEPTDPELNSWKYINRYTNLQSFKIFLDDCYLQNDFSGALDSISMHLLNSPSFIALEVLVGTDSFPDIFIYPGFSKVKELRIRTRDLKGIPESIANFKNLESLEIDLASGNKELIADTFTFISLPQGISVLHRLKSLSIYGPVDSLPEAYRQLCNLQTLLVKGKYKHTPVDFSCMDSLQELYIHSAEQLESFTYNPGHNYLRWIMLEPARKLRTISLGENNKNPEEIWLTINDAPLLTDIRPLAKLGNTIELELTNADLPLLLPQFAEVSNIKKLLVDAISLNRLNGKYLLLANLNHLERFQVFEVSTQPAPDVKPDKFMVSYELVCAGCPQNPTVYRYISLDPKIRKELKKTFSEELSGTKQSGYTYTYTRKVK